MSESARSDAPARFDAYVIQVDGETSGIVVRHDRGFRFFSASDDFVLLEGRTFRRPRDARRAAADHLQALQALRRLTARRNGSAGRTQPSLPQTP